MVDFTAHTSTAEFKRKFMDSLSPEKQGAFVAFLESLLPEQSEAFWEGFNHGAAFGYSEGLEEDYSDQ